MKKISFILSTFPSKRNPYLGSFVAELVSMISEQGIDCDVINPISLKFGNLFPCPKKQEIVFLGYLGNRINVYHPFFFSFLNRLFPFIPTFQPAFSSFFRAAENILKTKQKPTALYGHFLSFSGYAVCRFSKTYGIPAFVGVGDSTFWGLKNIPPGFFPFSAATGYIAVSSKIQKELSTLFGIPSQKIFLAPNGVDQRRFKPLEKKACREKLGFHQNTFIVSFVGHLNDRKGIHRLVEAIKPLSGVSLAIAGRGEMIHSNNVIFQRELSPMEIPEFLNASDVFVLPTLAEGSCNAIIEAFSCGLPVISSNLDFNSDLLNDSFSIGINPNSIEEIRNAIDYLHRNPSQRQTMAANSLVWARNFSLQHRAQKILAWMKDRIHEK